MLRKFITRAGAAGVLASTGLVLLVVPVPPASAAPAPAPVDTVDVVWSEPLVPGDVPAERPVVARTDKVAVAVPVVVPAEASRYVSTTPNRVLDTRRAIGFGRALNSNETITLPIAGGPAVPVGATAVVLNVTATAATGWGYVSVYPSGQPLPEASSLNVEHAGQTMANLVTVPLGVTGAVDLYTSIGTHLIADVQGYYVPAQSATVGRFVPTEPTRLVDTRSLIGGIGGALGAGADVEINVADLAHLPGDVDGAVLKVTVAGAAGAGYWTLYPAATTRPDASNVNAEFAGQTIASQAIVRLATGRIRVFAETGGQLIIDLVGYFTGAASLAGTAGLFVPVNPGRVLDTRQGSERPGVRRTVEVSVANRFGIPATGVAAVVTNVTAAGANPGYVSVWAARRYRPNASSLNMSVTGQTIAGHVITPVTDAGFAVYTDAGTDLIADVFGWYLGAPAMSVLPAHVPLPAISGPPASADYRFIYRIRPDGSVDSSTATAAGGTPVGWNPCVAIRYAVNLGGYPAGYLADIEEAFDRLSSATGLTFVNVGSSAFMPTYDVESELAMSDVANRTGAYDVLVALGNEQVTDLLDGSTVGVTGSVSRPLNRHWQTIFSSVVIDVADVADQPTWNGLGVGQVMLHEFAHMVGLDHVPTPNQIMYPYLSGVPMYGPGDLRGLWELGPTIRPCA